MIDDAPTTQKSRQARQGDGDDIKPIWHVIHQQDARLSDMDRELAELRRAMSDLTVSVSVMSRTIQEIADQFDRKLAARFSEHEKREAEMQTRAMTRAVLLLLTGMGALVMFVLSRVTFAAHGIGS